MSKVFTLDPRHCGPPDSGNGGYTSGVIAGFLPWETTTVTLRTPPPLGVELTVEEGPDAARVLHGDVLVAEAAPGAITSEPVEPVTFDEALAVRGTYPGFTHHPFPTCFTCGPRREEGDGLRVFPGRIPDTPDGPGRRTAAVWRVPAEPEKPLVWAALDCPGGWTNDLEVRPRLLGRLTGHVREIPHAEEDCLVMGRLDALDGRKATVTTSLYGADGRLLGEAVAIWISTAR